MLTTNLNFRQPVPKELIKVTSSALTHPSYVFMLIYHHAVLAFNPCFNKKLMWLALILCMLCCFTVSGAYTRSFCEFIGEPQQKISITKKLSYFYLQENVKMQLKIQKTTYCWKMTWVFKVQWLHFTGEVDQSKTAYVKLIPHFVYRKLFKSVHFWLSHPI